jgi:hypothetical protein
MKKLGFLMIIVLTILTMGACETKNADVSQIVGNDTIMIEGSNIFTYIIDSCEYIGSSYSGFTHKGNCKFCAEREAKKFSKLDSLIIKNEILMEELKNKTNSSSTYGGYSY